MSTIVCFHSNQNCGESRGNSSLVKLLDCTDDVQSHLSTYHLSREGLSEYRLILARSGRFDLTNAEVANWWVCPRHRHSLGKFWFLMKRSCNMPNHTCAVKTLTGRDVVTYELAKWAQKLYGLNVQLGAGMCSVIENHWDLLFPHFTRYEKLQKLLTTFFIHFILCI